MVESQFLSGLIQTNKDLADAGYQQAQRAETIAFMLDEILPTISSRTIFWSAVQMMSIADLGLFVKLLDDLCTDCVPMPEGNIHHVRSMLKKLYQSRSAMIGANIPEFKGFGYLPIKAIEG